MTTTTGNPPLRTWVLRSVKAGQITVTLTDDAVLTVVVAPAGVPARREERRLKDYAGALRYIEQFVLERTVRGYRLISDSYRDQLAAEARAKAEAEAKAAALKPAVDPGVARVRVVGAVERAGWLAVSCAQRIDAGLMDKLLGPDIDALQLVCDGTGGDDDDDDDEDEGDDEGGGEDGDDATPDEPDHRARSVRCLRAVAQAPRLDLRTLVLDTHWQTLVRQVDEEHGNRWGDLSVVLNALSSLEHVYAAGLFWLRKPLSSEHLRHLTIASSDLGDTLNGLHKSTLPALTHLGVASSGEEDLDAMAVAALVKLLRSKALPALTHLDVEGAPDPVAVLEAAARRPLQQVRVAGPLGDEDDVVPRLLKLAKALGGCPVHLALDTLSEAATTALRQAFPGLVDDHNHDLFLPTRYEGYI